MSILIKTVISLKTIEYNYWKIKTKCILSLFTRLTFWDHTLYSVLKKNGFLQKNFFNNSKELWAVAMSWSANFLFFKKCSLFNQCKREANLGE